MLGCSSILVEFYVKNYFLTAPCSSHFYQFVIRLKFVISKKIAKQLRQAPHLNCPSGTVFLLPEKGGNFFPHRSKSFKDQRLEWTDNTLSIRSKFFSEPFLSFFSSFLNFEIWTLNFLISLLGQQKLVQSILKVGVSLADPSRPKSGLQILPTTLRIKTPSTIPNCSKASGVFSSCRRYPASLPELHFHRALRWDSPQVVTPFMRVGTYPTRYFATLTRL